MPLVAPGARRLLGRSGPVAAFVLLLVLLEAAQLAVLRDGFREVQPLAIVYGIVVLGAAAIGLGLVAGDVRLGLALIGVAWTALCAASVAKRRYSGSPLYPWDLLRVREVAGIWDELPGMLQGAVVIAASVVAVAAVAWALGVVRARAAFAPRVREVVAGIALLAVVILPFHPAARAWFPGAGNALSVALRLRNVRWWPEKNYEVNGFTAGFLMSIDTLEIARPRASPPALAAECDDLSARADAGGARVDAAASAAGVPAVDGGTRPDVIVLLLESFVDPLTLGIPFSRDPMPFLRGMIERSGHAELHSTVWAHGTANAEFEILTGLSTAFLPPESVVFFHYLHAPLRSLATELRRVGYRAEALHPNAGWFYARAVAYPLLGFERSWFQHDFVPRRAVRARISDDRVFFAKVRERLTDAASQGRPEFLWGVTLATHGPYARKRSPRCDLRIGDGATGDGGTASRFDEGLESLWVYACLLERLDAHMRDLVRWLELRGTPYVLFAYGDHWPPLGSEMDAYRDAVAARGAAARPHGDGAALRVSTTPLVMWSNVDVPLPRGYRGGFNFLGPAVLRAAGVEPRCQFAVLGDLHARAGLIHPGLLGVGVEPGLAASVQQYWALTHRLLIDGRTARVPR